MALVFKDRVNVTSTTEGVGVFTLGSAVIGYQDFSAIGNGNTVYYTISSQTGTEWEVGIGTYTALGSLLSRDSVLSSSNSGALVSFTAGVKNVFVTYPAEKAVSLDATQTLTNKTINGSSNTITNVSLSTGVTGTLPAANGGTGLTSPGTSGNMLVSNGTAWTSQAVSASPSIQAVASGSLSDGTKVVVNSDGTVSAVGGSVSVIGNETFTGIYTTYNPVAVAYDSINKKVMVVSSDSSGGYAVVGIVSGNTISFGSPVNFLNVEVNYRAICYDTYYQTFLIAYTNSSSGQSFAMSATITSGTSISFGSPLYFAYDYPINAIQISSASSYLAVNCNYGIYLFYIDGGGMHNNGSGNPLSNNCQVIASNKVSGNVVAFGRTSAPNYYGQYSVGTGTSFGAATVFLSEYLDIKGACYDSANNKFVVVYTNYTQGNNYAVVATLSGSSLTFGTPVVLPYTAISCAYNSSEESILILGRVSGSYIASTTAKVVGTSLSIISSTTSTIPLNTGGPNCMAYDSFNNRFVAGYSGTSSRTQSSTISSASVNLTDSNFIGISNGAYANGQTATIQVVGSVDDAQSGLTAGKKYYVTTAGDLTLTSGANPYAGVAVSSTKLLIKG